MAILPDGRQRAHLPPHFEALELRDVGTADLNPTLGSGITWDDVERMWAAEMERRDRLADCPAGYRDAACEACGTALFVPVSEGVDVLCPQCGREGEALAAEDDDDPRPPAGGALHPDYPRFAAAAARMLDDELCAAVGAVDDETTQLTLDVPRREAVLAAMSAEVVRRLERRAAA